jgi:hypothetical protein
MIDQAFILTVLMLLLSAATWYAKNNTAKPLMSSANHPVD